MGLDLRKLEDLKEKMQVEEDFGAIWKFFFDHFGENPEFMALGAQADEEMRLFLEPILESICKQLVNREVMAAQHDLVKVVGEFMSKLVKTAPAGERPED